MRGERGPRGDHGQEGHIGLTGEDGATGDAGADGIRGPVGLQGASAPRRNPILVVLNTITVLCGLIIVGVALWLALDAARDENRLVADRDAERVENARLRDELGVVQDQLTAVQDNRLEEQRQEDCRNLYLVDITVTEAAIVDDNLLSVVVELSPTDPDRDETIRTAVAELQAKKDAHRAAIDAFLEYTALDPPPVECPHAEAQTP